MIKINSIPFPDFKDLHRYRSLCSCFVTIVSSLSTSNDEGKLCPFPFIIWSLGPGWPCWKRCEGNHFQMCTSEGAPGARVRVVSCRAEAIYAPCLLPIFRIFSSLWHPSSDLLQTPAEAGALQAAETQEANPLIQFIIFAAGRCCE